jgi:hypothetical protein
LSAREPSLIAAAAIDLFDFTVGRVLFATPFAGEIIGCAIGYALYGPRALFYVLEAFDPTEQVDAFIPTMTLIARAERRAIRARAEKEAHQVKELSYAQDRRVPRG